MGLYLQHEHTLGEYLKGKIMDSFPFEMSEIFCWSLLDTKVGARLWSFTICAASVDWI